MIHNPFEMVVMIVLIVSVAGVLRARFSHRRSRPDGNPAEIAENRQLREEVKTLKERVAVLERIATDKNHLLEQEFERLRNS